MRLSERAAEHSRDLVIAREEERRRLGRELHDELGPTVAGLSMQLGALQAVVRTDPDAAVARLANLERSAASALVDIRRVAHDLRPPVLDQVGLVAALQHLGESLGLAVGVDGDVGGPLPAAVELAAYRIGAEALANVVRHAGVRRARIAVVRDGPVLELEVSDSGAAAERSPGQGVGLGSMRERAEEIGGSLAVDAGPRGWVVRARLPLRPAPTGVRASS